MHCATAKSCIRQTGKQINFLRENELRPPSPRPVTLLKKGLQHKCFPVEFAKFLITPFITEHLWRLLLVIVITVSISVYRYYFAIKNEQKILVFP